MPTERDEIRLDGRDADWSGVQVAALRGRERISQPFQMDLDVVVSPDGRFDEEQALGALVEIVFLHAGDERRRVHGVIAGVVDLLRGRAGHRELRLEIRPRLARLALVETQEVFLGLSIPDVIAQKLELAGFVRDVDFRFALAGTYLPRELVVQYRETDLAFIGRLTEHLGISYHFEHVDGDGGVSDRVVFTDQAGEFPAIGGDGEARYVAEGGSLVGVSDLAAHRRLMPTLFAVQDYNYRIPAVDLAAVREVPEGNGGGVVEYAPNAKSPDEARALAAVRAQERAALCRFFTGEGHVSTFSAGSRFRLHDHPRVEDGTSFLLVEVEHHVRQAVGLHAPSAADNYRNTFRAVRSDTTYRPPRRTPLPRIHGVLTAEVSPLASDDFGAVARLDDDGRYRVRFHFDSAPPEARATPSHPIRMVQQHAGPGFGTHFPLKPGTEVQIAFLDGDPDRPIILGAAPNAVTPSPVAARDATRHRIKTAAGVLIEMGERPGVR